MIIRIDDIVEDCKRLKINANFVGYYALLEFLSNYYDNKIFIDCGTYTGYSARAVAKNRSNTIFTYDIKDYLHTSQRIIVEDYENNIYKNIIFELKDINTLDEGFLKSAQVIFLDVNPHDGIQEETFINTLIKCKFSGILLIDDINFKMKSSSMRATWDNIKIKKYETLKLHHTGFGIVDFGNNIKDVIL